MAQNFSREFTQMLLVLHECIDAGHRELLPMIQDMENLEAHYNNDRVALLSVKIRFAMVYEQLANALGEHIFSISSFPFEFLPMKDCTL